MQWIPESGQSMGTQGQTTNEREVHPLHRAQRLGGHNTSRLFLVTMRRLYVHYTQPIQERRVLTCLQLHAFLMLPNQCTRSVPVRSRLERV